MQYDGITPEEEKNIISQLKASPDIVALYCDQLKFAAAASQAYREPYRNVKVYLQLLSRNAVLDPKSREYLGLVEGALERLNLCISDMFNYMQLDLKPVRIETVDCNALLEEVLNSLSEALKHHKIEIVRSPLPTIPANREDLFTIFRNLVHNAIKFHGNEYPSIKISVSKKEEAWTFSVSDNGIGVAKVFHDYIFKPFGRLHPTQDYPGSGLGLATCKKLAQRQNGEIWVESAVGSGSCFHFTIGEFKDSPEHD